METLHLAYSAVDDTGIARDVSLLLDAEDEGEALLSVVIPKLEAFLKGCGLIADWEHLTTT